MCKSNLLAYFTPSKGLSIELITCHNNNKQTEETLCAAATHPLNIQKKKCGVRWNVELFKDNLNGGN